MKQRAPRLNLPTRIAETLLAFSSRRRGALYLVFAVVAVVGIAALQRLPRDLPPSARALAVTVEVADPGMPAQLMETRVTQPLEHGLTGIAGAQVSSVTVEGLSTVELRFPPAADVASILDAVHRQIAQTALPTSVDAPKITAPSPAAAVELVLVSGIRNPKQLRAWADESLVSQLVSLAGVAAVRVTGGGEREIHVTPDQRRLAGAGLALGSLVRTLRAAGNMPLSTTAPQMTPASVGALAALPLRLPNGESIALSEVARVEEVFDPGIVGVLSHGFAGIRLDVIPQMDAPAAEVAERVAAHLSWMRVNGLVPESVELSPVYDMHEAVRASLVASHRAAFAGILLLVLVVVAALRRPMHVLVTLAMVPFAVLTGAIFLYLGGQALDVCTYAGLGFGAALALGFALRVATAGAAGARYRAGLDFAATGVVAVTAVAVALIGFVPAAGPVGQLYGGLLVAVAGAFAGGVVFVLTVIPAALAGRSVSGHKHPISSRVDRRVVRWRPTRGQQILAALGLVATATVLWGAARQAPGVTAATRAVLEYALPEADAAARSAEIEREARRLESVRQAYTVTQKLPARDGARHIILRTQLEITGNGAAAALAALCDRLEKSGVATALRLIGRDGELNRVRVTISGPDTRELTVLGASLAGRMSDVTGVRLLPEPLPPLVPDVALLMDAIRLDALGIDPAEVERVSHIVRSVPVVSEFAAGERRVRLRLRAPPEEAGGGKILLAGELGDRPVVYLRDVARIEPAIVPAEIRHRDGVRAVSIGATVMPGHSPAQTLAAVRSTLLRAALPVGYTLSEIAFVRAAIDGVRPLMALMGAMVVLAAAPGYRLGRRRLSWALVLMALFLAVGAGLVVLPAAGGQVAGGWVALLLLSATATILWLVAGEIMLPPRDSPPAQRFAAWRAGLGALVAMSAAALILWWLAPLGEARQVLGVTLLLGLPTTLAGVVLALSANRTRR